MFRHGCSTERSRRTLRPGMSQVQNGHEDENEAHKRNDISRSLKVGAQQLGQDLYYVDW